MCVCVCLAGGIGRSDKHTSRRETQQQNSKEMYTYTILFGKRIVREEERVEFGCSRGYRVLLISVDRWVGGGGCRNRKR